MTYDIRPQNVRFLLLEKGTNLLSSSPPLSREGSKFTVMPLPAPVYDKETSWQSVWAQTLYFLSKGILLQFKSNEKGLSINMNSSV